MVAGAGQVGLRACPADGATLRITKVFKGKVRRHRENPARAASCRTGITTCYLS